MLMRETERLLSPQFEPADLDRDASVVVDPQVSEPQVFLGTSGVNSLVS
jgi:hypothetical protein